MGEDEPLPERTLNAVFDQFWLVFDKKLKALPDGPKKVEKRDLEDMVAEILEFTRAESNRRPVPSLFGENWTQLTGEKVISPLSAQWPNSVEGLRNVVRNLAQGFGEPPKDDDGNVND